MKSLETLVRNLAPDETLRLWSAGCASGEEAYSLAMLAHEALSRQGRPINFKVFATDIHDGSLNTASHGRYDIDALEFVSNRRREQFFNLEEDGNYRVNYDLRRHIVFAHHNVFKDPPFTRIHMICCRNLLIYLQPKVQLQALRSFQFSLIVDGILVLGSSENLGEFERDFRTIDSTWRVFQKTRHVLSNNRKSISFSQARTEKTHAGRRLINFLDNEQPKSLGFTRLLDSYELVLENLVHSGILIDQDRSILHVFGDASQYLTSQSGRFTGNIRELLQENSRAAITAGLIRAAKHPGKQVRLESVLFKGPQGASSADVIIRVLEHRSNETFAWLVEFVRQGAVSGSAPVPVVADEDGVDYSELREIEAELIYTKDNLNATIEELEASNEELNATNEELVASNEELQSTNEELQSVNEELFTVNLENNRKIDTLQELSSDLEFILDNSEVGTLFLDCDLAIRKFTERMRIHFDLMHHDIGRPIGNFRSRLLIEDLDSILRRVRDHGESYSGIVADDTGKSFQVRIDRYEKKGETTGVIINVSERLYQIGARVVGKFSVNEECGYWHWPNVSEDSMWWSTTCFEILKIKNGSVQPAVSSWKNLVHDNDLSLFEINESGHHAFLEKESHVLRLRCGTGAYRKFRIYNAFCIVEGESIKSVSGYLEQFQ